MLLDVAPLNVLNVSDFYAILSHRWSIVPLASRAACLVPASHGLPSSSPLRAFLSTYPALSPHFKEMLRALRRSSTPFSFLAAAFPFAICVLHFYTVLISCDALGGYASPSLSWPFFSSLSSVPSLFLPLSLFLRLSLLQHIILSIHGISYLCLAIAVKLAIVQLQRHGRLDVAPPHFVHLVHISVKLHLSFPPASIR